MYDIQEAIYRNKKIKKLVDLSWLRNPNGLVEVQWDAQSLVVFVSVHCPTRVLELGSHPTFACWPTDSNDVGASTE